jgi:hypothetical protein
LQAAKQDESCLKSGLRFEIPGSLSSIPV